MNKQLNLLKNYTENLHKTMWFVELNIKVYVIILLKILMKLKRIYFINTNIKKIKFF